MKLTKEEIHFIDNYLKNSDVVYVDVRMEMVDHIASAIEEELSQKNVDFYDVFKEYMAANKTELIKSNTKWFFSWKGVLPFLRFLIKPSVLAFGLCWFIFLYTTKSVDFNPQIFHYFCMLFGFSAFAQIFYLPYFLKDRYYSLERSVQLLFLMWFFNFNLIDKDYQPTLLEFTFYPYVFFGYAVFMIQQFNQIKKYKLI